MNFISIDFETANRHRSSICSLGVAIVENGRLIETAHFLIKPVPNYYDTFNTRLHGISDKYTRHEGSFEQQWADLKEYFHNKIIVAHNASFDCSALRYTLDKYNLSYPDLDFHCTMRLSQKGLNLPNHRLDTVSDYFNIRLNHHHAESDASAAALIALKLCEKHKATSLDQLSASLGFRVGKIINFPKTYMPFCKI